MPLAPPETDVESEVETSSDPVSQAKLGWPWGWDLHSLADDLRIFLISPGVSYAYFWSVVCSQSFL